MGARACFCDYGHEFQYKYIIWLITVYSYNPTLLEEHGLSTLLLETNNDREEKVRTEKKRIKIQVCYHSKLNGIVLLSFLSIVLNFLHNFSLGLSHQLQQRTVRLHGFHKWVLWTQWTEERWFIN